MFFKRGDRFDGHLVVNGSGSEEAPIVITAYGEGDKPILTGEVGSVGGGDYQEAIFVLNHEHMVFDGLEIRNERKVSRTEAIRAFFTISKRIKPRKCIRIQKLWRRNGVRDRICSSQGL